MLKTIIVKELRILFRQRAVFIALLVLLLMLIIAMITSQHSYRLFRKTQLEAEKQFRHEWETLDVGDPHGAAHYGTYIFKPPSTLSSFDKGIEYFTGNIYRIEAHKQHGFQAPPVPLSGNYLRFGHLTVAVVLQLFLPLLLIFLCFDLYTGEREQGTLPMLLLQGAGTGVLLTGKALAAVLLAVLLLCQLLLLFFVDTDIRQAGIITLSAILLAYILYAAFFALLGVAASAAFRQSGTVLMFLLGTWLLFIILLPRIMASTAERNAPLPSQFTVQKQMSDAEKFGLDGKSPRALRVKQFTDSLLRHYHTDSLKSLPVNADALLMQAGEEYNERIYEKYIGRVDSLIAQQNRYQLYGRFLDPFIALREISMALAGTDYAHTVRFQLAARQYRNDFIRRLNGKLAEGEIVSADFYRQMPPFTYSPPAIALVLQELIPAYAALLLWLCIPVAWLLFLHQRKQSSYQ
ncbi:MAG TPA: DUF3526 domain-containing protein [Chitinophaga sp.]|nr:DUF3526 domain-containing protein [Chitinophaga sp.]